MQNLWIKTSVAMATLWLAGCASSVEKVVEDRGQNIESIYARYAGGDEEAQFNFRKGQLALREADSHSAMTGFPPNPERVQHLFPKLPNPELFMYVRPHAVGASGSPVPAYITRFSLYEKTPYALPGETVETIRRNAIVDAAIAQQDREAAARNDEHEAKAKRTQETTLIVNQ